MPIKGNKRNAVDHCNLADISLIDFDGCVEWLVVVSDTPNKLVATQKAIQFMIGIKEKTIDANIFFEASAVLATLQFLQDLGIRKVNASLE